MKDYTDIANPETYAGKWVAFTATETEATVLASAESISDLVVKPEVQNQSYILHKFPPATP